MEKKHFICHSCGKKAEGSSEKPPCEVLAGWLMATHWKGLESVDQYMFCSFSCLQRWVDANVPRIPEIFLKSFGEENGKS